MRYNRTMSEPRRWSRSEVEHIVSEAISLYERERYIRWQKPETARGLVNAEVAGILDYDEKHPADEKD